MSLELSDVHKSYISGKSELKILKGVNLKIESGQAISIMGESGSGKTTLLTLLAGLGRPDQGSIQLGDAKFEELDRDQLTKFRAKNIGVIFQNYYLIPHYSALENVMLPLEILNQENPKERAMTLLEQVGLGHRIDHLPSQLSGGECQRVAIARALAGKPEVILADEPSGSLDEETGEKVMNLLFDLSAKEKTTLILVTHSKRLAQKCPTRYMLHSGVLAQA